MSPARQVKLSKKGREELDEFLSEIDNDKLKGFPEDTRTIYSNQNFRLDMQSKTSKHGFWNLQIQINNQATMATLRELAGATVATVICPRQFHPEELKAKFKQSAKEQQPIGPLD